MSKNKQMRVARENERVRCNICPVRNDAEQIAAVACRPFVALDIPRDLFELAYIIEHSSRAPSTYPGHVKARALVARQMPPGIFTSR